MSKETVQCVICSEWMPLTQTHRLRFAHCGSGECGLVLFPVCGECKRQSVEVGDE